MVRSALSTVALVLTVGVGLLLGCQDNAVGPDSETNREDDPSVMAFPESTATGAVDREQLRLCDNIVWKTDLIQDAVNGAESGDVLCVFPGTYKEQIVVDESVTLQGLTPPTSGAPVVIEGWVSLEAEGAALRRVRVTREEPFSTPGSFTPDPFGVRVRASNTVVARTVVRGIGEPVQDGSINGIQVFGETPLSNVRVEDNIVRDYRNADDEGTPVSGVAGIKIQADVSDVVVAENSVRDLHGAFGFGVVITTSASADGTPKNVLVEENTLAGINDGSVFNVFRGPNDGRDAAPLPGSAVGLEANAAEATVRYNNLLAPNGAESKDADRSLIAQCNWWGDRSGPTDDENPRGQGTWVLERNDAEIEYTPWLTAPSPLRFCFGGKKSARGGGE
jgi:nitrous oxidase accessory protein NosD